MEGGRHQPVTGPGGALAERVGDHVAAAELQQRLGQLERAAEARAYAEHARALHRLAGEELADYQAQIAAVKDKAGRPPRRSA